MSRTTYIPIKILFTLLALTFTSFTVSVDRNDLKPFNTSFKGPLKRWTDSFNGFDLSGFSQEKTVPFEHIAAQDFNNYKTFLAVYKPFLSYSPDSAWFIDIYSAQLGLQRKGDHYEANPDVDQPIFLCHPVSKYWERIYFGTPQEWIEEVVWVDGGKFILAGSRQSETEGKRVPVVLLGDVKSGKLVRYVMRRGVCFQKEGGYQSERLKKMRISGI